jgi:hypothetical protein
MKQHLETHFKDSRRPRPLASAGSSTRHALRVGCGGGRGLTRDMVRLRPRQIQIVSTEEGNEALA